MSQKKDLITSIIDKEVPKIHVSQINLDIEDLTISDIFRGFNKTFPKYSKDRNMIASADMVVAILLKSELLDPIKGIIIIITDDTIGIDVSSKDYIVFGIDEKKIQTEERILYCMERLTVYLAKMAKDDIPDFTLFYQKYIYDDFENH